jgi:hypothetical protein
MAGLQIKGSAVWFERWMLWWRRIVAMYASLVTTGGPAEVVDEDSASELLGGATEEVVNVGIGEDGVTVSEGTSWPLSEVVESDPESDPGLSVTAIEVVMTEVEDEVVENNPGLSVAPIGVVVTEVEVEVEVVENNPGLSVTPTALVVVRKPVVLGGQGHVVKLKYSQAVSVKVAV